MPIPAKIVLVLPDCIQLMILTIVSVTILSQNLFFNELCEREEKKKLCK